MERLVELTSPPVVGETYLVPCVDIVYNTTGTRPSASKGPYQVPVFGTIHRDPELGYYAGLKHLHIDQRFVKEDYLHAVHDIMADKLGAKPRETYWVNEGYQIPVIHIEKVHTMSAVEERPLECIRDMPYLGPVTQNEDGSWSEWIVGGVRGFGELEDKFEDKPITKCMKCPHRGIHLGSVPVRDGLITCPGHTMDFDAETKRLVRRTRKNQSGHYGNSYYKGKLKT